MTAQPPRGPGFTSQAEDAVTSRGSLGAGVVTVWESLPSPTWVLTL